MKALVTGASGFVGVHICKCLHRNGHYVRALTRENSNLKGLENLDIDLCTGDILDVDTLIEAANNCDTIFHTAAFFSYTSHSENELMTTAIDGTANVMKAAKETGIKKIILTSSSVIFGSTTDRLVLDEHLKHPESDPSPYTLSKINQEKTAVELAEKLDIKLLTACPTVCVGSDDYNLSESNAVIVSYLDDPYKFTWPGGCNIVDVEDVAMGHLLIAEHGKPGNGYLLGSENLTWSVIHKTISKLSGMAGPHFTAGYTASYLAAAYHELISKFTQKRSLVSRVQAKMVGRYYWYTHKRAATLGYRPISAEIALAKAISWLAASKHITAVTRNSMVLSREVYLQRENKPPELI